MKKKFSLCHFGTYRGFFNLFHGVRVMIFLMLVGLTHVSATASSQNAVISLKLKDVSLEEAVRSAEKQLKQDLFFYHYSVLGILVTLIQKKNQWKIWYSKISKPWLGMKTAYLTKTFNVIIGAKSTVTETKLKLNTVVIV